MNHFRPLLRREIKEKVSSDPIALLFSGGTDSLTVLWTLLDLGVDVTCYTFRLEQVESKDCIISKQVCDHWGVPYKETIIPYKEESLLLEEIKDFVRWMRTDRKTHIECTWPFTYLTSVIKEEQVWCALNADDLWGSSKKMSIKYYKDSEGFKEERERLLLDPRTSAWVYIDQLFKEQSKTLLSPYRFPVIQEYLLGLTWKELNKPKQKMIAYEAFKEEYTQMPIYRVNDNLQCGSGIREYLARLAPDGNIRGLYRRLYEEVKNNQLALV